MIVPAILFASLLRLSELVSLGKDAMPGVAEVDDRQRLVSGIHTISYPVVERVNVPAAVFTTLPSKWQSDGALARFSRFHWDRGPALTV